MDVLLTGGSGQVGQALQRQSPASWTLHAPAHGDLDIANADQVTALLASRPWGLVVNAAAYTAVDRAQTDVAAAWRINALGPAILAAEAARLDVPLIHLSTDYVFAGDKTGPYLEDDPVAPANVYGASKEGGEQAVRTAGGRHVILRTAWVISPDGANFAKTMLRLAADRPVLKVVDDQRGCPTSADDIAAAVIVVGSRLAADASPSGTYHFVNAGEASWKDLAETVMSVAGDFGAARARVEAITTADYPTPAKRPMNSVLSTAKIQIDFGIRPRPWRIAAEDVVRTLLANRET